MLTNSTTTADFEIRAIALDVFGTTVDWKGSIIGEGALLREDVAWDQIANEWLRGYRSRVEAVRLGHREWAGLDALLAEGLLEAIKKLKISLTPEELAKIGGVWHRLLPWPDVIPGLLQLRSSYRLAALSNANGLLLIDMARFAGLPWDSVISAEMVRKYKPEKAVYMLAAETLGPLPQDVLYVAAHEWDLQVAQDCGFRSAFIPRPLEMRDNAPLPPLKGKFDIYARDFLDLAKQLVGDS